MTNAAYIDFHVLSEPWNTYRLADGTVLKLKFVLLKVNSSLFEEGKGQVGINQITLIVTEAPPSLRRSSGRDYSLDEITAAIVEPGMGIEPLRVEPSAYLMVDGKFVLAETIVRRVGKSSLTGTDGDPKYRVDYESRISVLGPVFGPGTEPKGAPVSGEDAPQG